MANDKPNKRSRIRFEPVDKKEKDRTAEPAEPPAAEDSPKQADQPSVATPQRATPAAAAPVPAADLPTVRVLAAGEAPSYSGLWRDERGIVVGTHALVGVRKQRRFAALLAALSHVLDLSDGVEIEASNEDTYWFRVTPSDPTVALSHVYDSIQGAMIAARLSARRAVLCVGDGHAYVPYFDTAAPHGYDISGSVPAQTCVVVLPREAFQLPSSQPIAMLDALRSVPLDTASQIPCPTTLTVLTDRRLAALIAGYVQRHGLAYSVRFLTWHTGQQQRHVALFDIVQANEVRPIPAFVIAFIQRLADTTVLTDVLDHADLEREPACRVLVAWGQRTPLYLPHIERLLPSDSALILAGQPWGSSLVQPLPPRQQMQHLTMIDAPAPVQVSLSDAPVGTMRLPLTLVPMGRARPSVHGMLLNDAALHRLRRLVRRLPAPWFAHARIVLGDGVALVIAPDAPRGIEGLPVGDPLACTDTEGLYLPSTLALRPTLPADLLIPTLNLQPDTLTVLTPTCRYDAPLDAFAPVHHLLTLDMPAQSVALRVQPVSLPLLDLSDLYEPPPVMPVAQPAPPPRSTEPPPQPQPQPSKPGGFKNIMQKLLDQKGRSDPTVDNMREHAAQLQAHGNYAAAALFYEYLGDRTNALACYHQSIGQEQS